ncbi:MAG: D-alanine--D-alanine ligase [Candidatus Woesearchaeota archaeon]
MTCSIKPQELKEGESVETYAEFDSIQTITDLKDAIASHGHEVSIYNADEKLFENLKNNRKDIDFVFNIAEGLVGAFRESVAQTYCEVLNIPYHGPCPLTAALTLNKGRTKEILLANNIPTPKFKVIYPNENNHTSKEFDIEGLSFPILIKPMMEGSSKGIFNENLVDDIEQLGRIVNKIISKYNQPVIVEEFLNGREFTVSVIGYGKELTVLPVVEITFGHLPEGIHQMDSYEAKWIYDSPEFIEKNKVEPVICPAEINSELLQQIENTVKKTFTVLDCKDWARIDMRLDKNGIANVLEVNALPGIMKDPKENSRLPKAAYAAGWTYEHLIGTVLKSALKRYNKEGEK